MSQQLKINYKKLYNFSSEKLFGRSGRSFKEIPGSDQIPGDAIKKSEPKGSPLKEAYNVSSLLVRDYQILGYYIFNY